MHGWILYKRNKSEINETDHGVMRLLQTAQAMGISLEVYRPDEFDILLDASSDNQVLLNGESVSCPDFIIPRMGAETTYHALSLIRHLEIMGVYSANNARSIEIVRDKLLLAQLFDQNKLPTPKTILLKNSVSLELIEQKIGFPLVIKPVSSARGIGVCLCDKPTHFMDFIGLLGLYSQNLSLIAQQFIASSSGRDLRVLVVNNRVIGCMQRKAKNSFKANYSMGGDVELYPLNKEIEHLALATTKLLNLTIAGIDLLFDDEGFSICEANSSPGFKGMELATGNDIAREIMEAVIENCANKPSKLS